MPTIVTGESPVYKIHKKPREKWKKAEWQIWAEHLEKGGHSLVREINTLKKQRDDLKRKLSRQHLSKKKREYHPTNKTIVDEALYPSKRRGRPADRAKKEIVTELIKLERVLEKEEGKKPKATFTIATYFGGTLPNNPKQWEVAMSKARKKFPNSQR